MKDRKQNDSNIPLEKPNRENPNKTYPERDPGNEPVEPGKKDSNEYDDEDLK